MNADQLQGALAYARLGLRVYPACGIREESGRVVPTCGRRTCSEPGKHPLEGGWRISATTKPARIRAWAKRYQDCNFGALDLVTVDVDPRSGGSLRALPDGLPRSTLITRTGGGGWHVSYVPNGQPVKGRHGIQQGVDLKADGGAIICAGSRHASGDRYRAVVRPDDPANLVPWRSPAAWVGGGPPGAATTSPSRSRLVDLLVDLPQHEGEGRNDTLTKVAGHLFKALPNDAARGLLRVVNRSLVEPLPEVEVARIEDSISARERAKVERADDAWAIRNIGPGITSPDPEPERFGPGGMFYQGAIHWLSGEPETGKSFLAYAAAVEKIKAGQAVLLLDEDAGERDVTSKMRALGLTEQEAERLLYLPPEGRNLDRDRHRLEAVVRGRQPALIILDAAADHFVAAGLDEDKAKDVTKLIGAIRSLSQVHNISVVVTDHKTKSDIEGRYGRGSGSKLAKSDVAYNVSMPDPFSRDRSGRMRVTCTKDKLGYIGRDTGWELHIMVADGRVRLQVADSLSPEDTRKLRDTKRGPVLADELAVVLENSLTGLLVGEILTALPNKKDGKPWSRNRIIEVLNADARFEPVPGRPGDPPNAQRWRLVES